MNDQHLAALAAWLKRSNWFASAIAPSLVIAYATTLGVAIDESDCVNVFHYVNNQRSNEHEQAALRVVSPSIWPEPGL